MSEDLYLKPLAPEQAGLPSEAIIDFLDILRSKQLCLHSVILLRHGRMIAEAYAPPYDAEKLHRMYSISKSFTAAAVGLLIGEGQLSLDDQVADLMLTDGGASLHPEFRRTTVRNLLTMSAPMDPNIYSDKTPDWTASFFEKSFSHAPGALFNYNTGATVLLSAIVEKLTGQTTMDYMRPRLLDPLGFSPEATCVQRPGGGDWGGSGVICSPRDLARFTQLLMQKGNWQGKQLLPETFVQEATSKQIDTGLVDMNSELSFGYGYQIWRIRNNGFAMVGMGGQYGIALPDKDFALITTADTQLHLHGANEILDALWSTVFPQLQDQSLTKDCEAERKLSDACANLRFPIPEGATASPTAAHIQGREYTCETNPMGLKSLRFDFTEGKCSFHYQNQTGDHCIELGMEDYLAGTFPETHYHSMTISIPANRPFSCMAAARWCDSQTLAATVFITDIHLGTLQMKFRFGSNDVSIQMAKAAEWFLDDYQGFAYGTSK